MVPEALTRCGYRDPEKQTPRGLARNVGPDVSMHLGKAASKVPFIDVCLLIQEGEMMKRRQ